MQQIRVDHKIITNFKIRYHFLLKNTPTLLLNDEKWMMMLMITVLFGGKKISYGFVIEETSLFDFRSLLFKPIGPRQVAVKVSLRTLGMTLKEIHLIRSLERIETVDLFYLCELI